MRHIDLRVGDVLEIDNARIVIHVEDKSGRRTRLGIEAPKDVSIRQREEKPSSAEQYRRLTPA